MLECGLRAGDHGGVCWHGVRTVHSDSNLLGPQRSCTCEEDLFFLHPCRDCGFKNGHSSAFSCLLFAGTEVRLALNILFEVASPVLLALPAGPHSSLWPQRFMHDFCFLECMHRSVALACIPDSWQGWDLVSESVGRIASP